MFKALLFALSAILFLSSCAPQAEDPIDSLGMLAWDDVAACKANSRDEDPPEFSEPRCQTMNLFEVDPQGKLLWMRAHVELKQTAGPNGEPLALFVSGKMASEVYLNGVFVGRNGEPGLDVQSEVAGQMDATFYPPQDLFKSGQNAVVLLVSSHRGSLSLAHPVHSIGIAPAAYFQEAVIRQSAPVYATLGIFILGAVYFGVMALISAQRLQFALLSFVSVSAAGQLVLESLRGLMGYSYPIHDLRLIGIAAFSWIFGMGVAIYMLRALNARHLGRAVLAIAVVSACAVLAIDGFDYKALAVMVVPLLACLPVTAIWAYQRRRRAVEHSLTIVAFVSAVIIFRTQFLDVTFFVLVAFLLMLLFVDQARNLAEEARQRRNEETRANRLEQALAQAEETVEPGYIEVKSAGQLERIATSEIITCKGAGGYSEIQLTNGRTVLHTASLNEMEQALPASFLRVHRSHLVNVQFIQSLARDASGTGLLSLREGGDIPVSRRIMPKVRKALT